MEFCGRCGHELGRGLERGRFCPKCGHETPGNARYPLYADGTAPASRPQPTPASPASDATMVAAVPVGAAARARSSAPEATPEASDGAADAPSDAAVEKPAEKPVEKPAAAAPTEVPTPSADVTRRRIPIIGDAQVVEQRSAESWKITLSVTIAAMVVIVILGFILLLH